MARLVVLSEGLSGRTYDLKVDRTTVGRVDDNAFQIPDTSISSHHCEILLKGNDVVVKDLDSTNGTFINGEKITESVLKPGQTLRLGQCELRLEEGPAGAAATGGETAAPQEKPKTKPKQGADQTRTITQGVKLNDLEQGTRPVSFDTESMFRKKSNRVSIIFISLGVVLALIIVALIIYAIIQSGKVQPTN
jgi:predicted component of type VI protein secretion system